MHEHVVVHILVGRFIIEQTETVACTAFLARDAMLARYGPKSVERFLWTQ